MERVGVDVHGRDVRRTGRFRSVAIHRVQIVQIERHQAAQFDVLRSAARRAAPVAHLQAHLQPALRVAASRRRRRP